MNWSGYLTLFPVQEERFDFAPKVTFGVILVNSMMSSKTTGSSHGSPFSAIFGPQIAPDLGLIAYAIDHLLRPPQAPNSQVQTPNPIRPVSAAPPTPYLPGVGLR